MQFNELSLPGVYQFTPFRHSDTRGEFVKTFHKSFASANGHDFETREEFFSVSKKNVLRGMHFQIPPSAHQKIVYCTQGRILDVLLDLRRDQPTFGKAISLELSESNRTVLWIPVGIAHGFLSLEEDSCVIYKTDREHDPASDRGIRWDSFGFEWPIESNKVEMSDRDQQHPVLETFESPF